MENEILIKKSTGKKEKYDEQKLFISLVRTGCKPELAKKVIRKIRAKVFQGISTKKIYKMAYSLLRKESQKVAAYYHLNKAIFELGPDGFYFEKFIASLLKAQGYQTKVDQVLKGKCISHEIDIVATKPGEKDIYIECKFHNQYDRINDVKVALYVDARAKDLMNNHENEMKEFWLVSNTKFSKDATEYSRCSGLILYGQDRPDEQAISYWVQKTGIHPITCLTTLRKKDKAILLKEEIITLQDLMGKKNILKKLKLDDKKCHSVNREIDKILHNGKGNNQK